MTAPIGCEEQMSWRCCRCQAVSDAQTMRCAKCGHWRCGEVVTWFEGREAYPPTTNPVWWSLAQREARPKSGVRAWAAARGVSRLHCRAAALAALALGEPFELEGGAAHLLERPVLLEANRVTAVWPLHDGFQCLVLVNGTAGAGWSSLLPHAKARALDHARRKPLARTGGTA